MCIRFYAHHPIFHRSFPIRLGEIENVHSKMHYFMDIDTTLIFIECLTRSFYMLLGIILFTILSCGLKLAKECYFVRLASLFRILENL